MNKDQSVGRGDVMKRRCFLVTKEHIRNPDLGPAVVAQLELGAVVISARVKRQSTIVPLLT